MPCSHCGKEVYRYASTMGRTLCSHKCRDAVKMAKRVKDGLAKCAKCSTWKPVDQFPRGTGGRPASYCKPCNSEWHHNRNGTPQERRKPYQPAYRLTEEEKRDNKREANRRQHMKRRAGGAAPSRAVIEGMWCSQHGRCAYCGVRFGETYHIDHKLPVSRGGGNEISNLQLTCPKCNMVKGAMTHEEFLVSKKRPVVSWGDHEFVEAVIEDSNGLHR